MMTFIKKLLFKLGWKKNCERPGCCMKAAIIINAKNNHSGFSTNMRVCDYHKFEADFIGQNERWTVTEL